MTAAMVWKRKLVRMRRATLCGPSPQQRQRGGQLVAYRYRAEPRGMRRGPRVVVHRVDQHEIVSWSVERQYRLRVGELRVRRERRGLDTTATTDVFRHRTTRSAHRRSNGLRRGGGMRYRDANLVHRTIRRLAATRPMAWVFTRVLHRVDEPILRRTGGRRSFTALVSGLPIVELTTTGVSPLARPT